MPAAVDMAKQVATGHRAIAAATRAADAGLERYP
ncbi:MAG: hypothetical protein JWP04_2662 [Belnapia sp.]|nr:hypothetical protein [Belnapia sp.]